MDMRKHCVRHIGIFLNYPTRFVYQIFKLYSMFSQQNAFLKKCHFICISEFDHFSWQRISCCRWHDQIDWYWLHLVDLENALNTDAWKMFPAECILIPLEWNSIMWRIRIFSHVTHPDIFSRDTPAHLFYHYSCYTSRSYMTGAYLLRKFTQV